MYYYPPPNPCAMLLAFPQGHFFLRKWCPWKFPTCILSNLMFLLNIWIMFGQCLSSRWVSRSIWLLTSTLNPGNSAIKSMSVAAVLTLASVTRTDSVWASDSLYFRSLLLWKMSRLTKVNSERRLNTTRHYLDTIYTWLNTIWHYSDTIWHYLNTIRYYSTLLDTICN